MGIDNIQNWEKEDKGEGKCKDIRIIEGGNKVTGTNVELNTGTNVDRGD